MPMAMPSDHDPTDAAPHPSSGRLDRLDRELSRRAAVDWPHPRWFTVPLGGLSLSANYGVLWYVLCLVPWLFGVADPIWKALYVAAPVTLVEMTGFVIKHFVGRARPPVADPSQPEQIPLPLSKSFPSSHASMAVVGTFTLGDRTYTQTFCHGGKRFDELLAELNAERIGEVMRHDASTGTIPEEIAVEWAKAWVEALEARLKEAA